MNITNHLNISTTIASSGQPSEQDFQYIAQQGFNTVINLALSSSKNALVLEGDIVTELGMNYIHIPVQWESPTVEQFTLFATLMQQQTDNKVWVHCALNMRVSVFLYLYNTLYRDIPEQDALAMLNKIWTPNDTWQQYIVSVRNAVLPS